MRALGLSAGIVRSLFFFLPEIRLNRLCARDTVPPESSVFRFGPGARYPLAH